MKNYQKYLLAVFAVLMLALCIPHKAEAKDYHNFSVTNLVQERWITLKGSTTTWIRGNAHTTHSMYKVKVPSNVYAIVETKNLQESILINNSYEKNEVPTNKPYVNTQLYYKKKHYVVLPKGTYYVFSVEGATIRWTFKRSSNPANYCRTKAKLLESGKKELIVFTDGYEYDRWYKIVLTRKKALTVNLTVLDKNSAKNFCVYNSKGERIDCREVTYNKTYRTDKIPKGTYYVRIKYTDSSLWDLYDSRVAQLSWK